MNNTVHHRHTHVIRRDHPNRKLTSKGNDAITARRVLLAAGSLAAALALAACASTSQNNRHVAMSADRSTRTASGQATSSAMPGMGETSARGTGSATPATAPFNSSDVAFLTEMIPHHAQAVTMADMTARGATTAGVRTLAAAITVAQTSEIDQMSGWLTGWHQPVPPPRYQPGSMSDMSTPGMMSDHDMMGLKDAHGVTFDRMWLTMMIAHHQGALTMAKTELAHGANIDAKALAQSIIASQSAQIRQMYTMIADLPR